MCTICNIQYFNKFLTNCMMFHVKSDLYIINIPENIFALLIKNLFPQSGKLSVLIVLVEHPDTVFPEKWHKLYIICRNY